MDNGFSVLVMIFGAAILLYAAMLSGGNYKLLPLKVQPTPRSKDKKGQTKHIAKMTAIVGLTPLIGGLAGFWRGNLACLIGMGVTAAVCIVIAVLKNRRKPHE